MKKSTSIFLCIVLMTQKILAENNKAIIIAPVVDLVGQPLVPLYHENSAQAYQQLPLCGMNNDTACPRIHQLLFNEIVMIVDEKNDEFCIEIPVFYQKEDSPKRFNRYWSHKKNFIYLTDLYKNGINNNTLPFESEKQERIIITKPWYNKATKTTYSAGTCFVRTPSATPMHYSIYIFDPLLGTTKICTIPKKICLPSTLKSPQESIENFLTLLQQWTRQKEFIPYVWGGCSFITHCKHSAFDNALLKINNQEYSYYTKDECCDAPKTGFDCTGLILRAALICNMPYYFKNTTTIAANLEPLKENELPVNGDLIWFAGHVMVINDIKQGTIIEARAYKQGFGKIHEISLNHVFKGINTIQDLVSAYREKKPLERLNAKKESVQKITTFKLLSLASIWHNHEKS